MAKKVSRSDAVQLTHRLIRECKMEETFEFEAEIGKGAPLLHRIRVELSRLRSAAIAQGLVPRHFKIIHIQTDKLEDKPGYEKVIIKRTRSVNNVSDDVRELFEIIATPEKKAAGAN